MVIPYPKKSHHSIRMWVRSEILKNMRICEFRLGFLSFIYIYIYIKKLNKKAQLKKEKEKVKQKSEWKTDT